MKVLNAPKVYLIAHTEIQPGLLQYLQDTHRIWDTVQKEEETKSLLEGPQETLPAWVEKCPGDALAEFSGRICYDAFRGPGAIGSVGRKSNEEYLDHIKSVAHGSVAEHPVASFMVIGASRGFSHELVRHRAGFAYSQSSTRYCDGEQLNVVLPHLLDSMRALAKTEDQKKAVEDAVVEFSGAFEKQRDLYSQCFKTLNRLATEILSPHYEDRGDKTLLRKMVRSAARNLLPIGTEAPLVFSGNYRAIRHALTMRATEAAELEIRAVFMQVFYLIREKSPNFFSDWEVYTLRDGTEALKSKYVKV